MKKNSFLHISIWLSLATVASSCSYFQRKERVNDELKEKASNANFVERYKYDDLLAKYEDLLKHYEEKKAQMEEASVVEKEVAAGTKNSDSMLLDKVEMRDEKVKDEKSMVTQLEKALEEKSMPALSENQPVVVDEMQPQKIGKNDEKAIFKESDLLRQALESLEKDDYSTSMLTFQKLEHSSFPQIQVRAKFYIGEVLFKQKEFDLALQVYEEIIKKYAFSGMIVKALERSKACSQELKLDNKFEKYQSLYALLLR